MNDIVLPLISTPLAPTPEGATVLALKTQDGAQLRVAKWDQTLGRERGTIVLLQGRTEFIEKYFEVVDDLRARGLGVVTLDWRGQGLSDRLTGNPLKGHIDTFRHYDLDLAAIMQQVVLNQCRPPYFALSHSMGGAILLRALAKHHDWFERVVLCAPMVDLHPRLQPNAMRMVAEFACLWGLSKTMLPKAGTIPEFLTGFADNNFTHDEARFTRIAAQILAEPRLGIAAPTFGWGRAAGRAMAEFKTPEFINRIETPFLMVAAGADTIVSTPAIEAFSQNSKVGRTVVVDGGKHELMMEKDTLRQQFWAAFDSFIPGERPGL